MRFVYLIAIICAAWFGAFMLKRHEKSLPAGPVFENNEIDDETRFRTFKTNFIHNAMVQFPSYSNSVMGTRTSEVPFYFLSEEDRFKIENRIYFEGDDGRLRRKLGDGSIWKESHGHWVMESDNKHSDKP